MDPTILPNEIGLHILSFLSGGSLFIASQVSKRWNILSVDCVLWKNLIAFEEDPGRLNTTGMIVDQNHPSPFYNGWFRLYRDLGSILIDEPPLPNLVSCGVLSSSANEVLNDADVTQTVLDNQQFWTSAGSPDNNAREFLVYKLAQSLCIITHIDLAFFKNGNQPNSPTYASKAVRVAVGFDENIANMHFTSEIAEVRHTDEMQRIHLAPMSDKPTNKLIYGGFVYVELLGQREQQSVDQLWYTAVRHVRVCGLPFSTLAAERPALAACLRARASENSVYVANSIAEQLAIIDSEIFLRKIMATIFDCVHAGQYEEAIEAACSLSNAQRPKEIMNWFSNAPHPTPSGATPLVHYLSGILARGQRLSQDESGRCADLCRLNSVGFNRVM